MKKWFRGLIAGSLRNFQEFKVAFLRKWEGNKNPLQLLNQYISLKIDSPETIQEFSTRFMRVYSSIHADVKPPIEATKLHFADAFDSDFALLLRERRFATLTDMIEDVVEVEENLMASGKMKGRVDTRAKNRVETCVASTSQTGDAKFDMMMKTMEKLKERLEMEQRKDLKEPAKGQNRNQNFIRPPIPKIQQREQRNLVDHLVRPPFQDNYVTVYYEDPNEDQIHQVDNNDTEVYLTKEEHDRWYSGQEGEVLYVVTEDYQQG